MKVLLSEHPELKAMIAVERLAWLGSRSVGALSFYVKQHTKEQPLRGIEELERIRRKSIALHLNKISAIGEPDATWALTSHGGARPKVAFTDGDGHWLVKFDLDFDGFSSAHVEHATKALARQAGIDAVRTKVVELDGGENALFVERYDRTIAEEGTESRVHRISAFTLLEQTVDRQDGGDYLDIFSALRGIACDYEKDAKELFRRMAFNIAVNNTDDHLRNFEFIHCCSEEGQDCYRLGPMYDVVPNPAAYPHVTSLAGDHYPVLDAMTISKLSETIGLDTQECIAIRDSVFASVANWQETFAKNGVSSPDLQAIAPALAQGQYRDRPPSQWPNPAAARRTAPEMPTWGKYRPR